MMKNDGASFPTISNILPLVKQTGGTDTQP